MQLSGNCCGSPPAVAWAGGASAQHIRWLWPVACRGCGTASSSDCNCCSVRAASPNTACAAQHAAALAITAHLKFCTANGQELYGYYGPSSPSRMRQNLRWSRS